MNNFQSPRFDWISNHRQSRKRFVNRVKRNSRLIHWWLTHRDNSLDCFKRNGCCCCISRFVEIHFTNSKRVFFQSGTNLKKLITFAMPKNHVHVNRSELSQLRYNANAISIGIDLRRLHNTKYNSLAVCQWKLNRPDVMCSKWTVLGRCRRRLIGHRFIELNGHFVCLFLLSKWFRLEETFFPKLVMVWHPGRCPTEVSPTHHLVAMRHRTRRSLNHLSTLQLFHHRHSIFDGNWIINAVVCKWYTCLSVSEVPWRISTSKLCRWWRRRL